MQAKRQSRGKSASKKIKTGPKPKPITQYPIALLDKWKEPIGFCASLDFHIKRFGENPSLLSRAVSDKHKKCWPGTMRSWISGRCTPDWNVSLEILRRIESRYALPAGYFRRKLDNERRFGLRQTFAGFTKLQQSQLRWHLPIDFLDRSPTERRAILRWIKDNAFSGAVEYGGYMRRAAAEPYAVKFPMIIGQPRRKLSKGPGRRIGETSQIIEAKGRLADEVASLIHFKTSALTEMGYRRLYVWRPITADIKLRHLGYMLGALAAPSSSAIGGLGIRPEHLTLGLLAFPQIWDWYFRWRERRRGFLTCAEVEMALDLSTLTRPTTGWLWQHPELHDRIKPVPRILSPDLIKRASRNWRAQCEFARDFAKDRAKDIRRVSRVHRDTLLPIMPVLQADSPLKEYRKIADEVWARRPDASRYPVAAAESMRGYLVLRFGMHTGLRQRNLRELLFTPKDKSPRSEKRLDAMKCGELRWSVQQNGWEIFIPISGFKNAGSSFFSHNPYHLLLPDCVGLYSAIEDYLSVHRKVLLCGHDDVPNLFIRTGERKHGEMAFDTVSFANHWKLLIQRYGIFNPFTNKGAIPGLLPHGPHNVRDVLATHVLKRTGSFEMASYAIQSTPEIAAKHYARFQPHDKSWHAAQILNEVWEAV